MNCQNDVRPRFQGEASKRAENRQQAAALQNGRMVDCEDMGNSFDISVGRLAGTGVPVMRLQPASEGGPYNGVGGTQDPGTKPVPGAPEEPKSTDRSVCATAGTFYLETFGF